MKKRTILSILFMICFLFMLFSGYMLFLTYELKPEYNEKKWFTVSDPSARYTLQAAATWNSSLLDEQRTIDIYCIDGMTKQTAFYLQTSLNGPDLDTNENYHLDWKSDGVILTLTDKHMQAQKFNIKWTDLFSDESSEQ